jgi:hypothetical protein
VFEVTILLTRFEQMKFENSSHRLEFPKFLFRKKLKYVESTQRVLGYISNVRLSKDRLPFEFPLPKTSMQMNPTFNYFLFAYVTLP